MSCYPIQLPTMMAENKAVGCKLKFKITTKGLWDVKSSEDADGHRDRVCVGGTKRLQANMLVKASALVNSGKRRSDMFLDGQRSKKQKVEEKSREATEGQRHRVSDGGSKPSERISLKPSMTVSSNKQRPEIHWKKQMMDRHLKLECGKVLKELMNHSLGWVFSEPVDPVKLKIPDYFEIIKNPMDLGTIKHKLEGNMYIDAKEFADDVKLTFENAKSYNPPSHDVHRWAEILDAIFRRRWRLLDTKLNHAHKNDAGVNSDHHTGSNGQDMKPAGLIKAPMPDKLGHSRRILLEDSQKSRPGPMQVCVQVKPGKIALNGCSSLTKAAEKEHRNRRPSASANLRQSIGSTEARCSSCVSGTCRCPKNSAAQTSATTSDISSERSWDRNRYADSKLDCEVKGTLESHANGFALDLDGPGVALNEEKSSHSTPATTPVSVEGWMADIQMSPRKALRAAMLKNRFADTIFRATHPTPQELGKKCKFSTMQQEKLQLKKEQLEEKARIEAQIKAAEAATRRKELEDSKLRRERERKAARMALEKMERTVELDRTASIMKDLEILLGLPVQSGYPSPEPLERLGLYMKDRYLDENEDEDEDANLNVEEGEILS